MSKPTFEDIILAASQPPHGFPEEEVREAVAKALADAHAALLGTLTEKVLELHPRDTAFDGELPYCKRCVDYEGAWWPCSTVYAIQSLSR